MAKRDKQDEHTKSGLLKIGAAVVSGILLLGKLTSGNKGNGNA
jgi:hypothetical protein